MPSLAEIWADCDDDHGTDEEECALGARYEGFWWHTAVNLAYTLTTGALLLSFAPAVESFRDARRDRFSDRAAADRYADARDELLSGATVVAILAAIPLLVVLL